MRRTLRLSSPPYKFVVSLYGCVSYLSLASTLFSPRPTACRKTPFFDKYYSVSLPAGVNPACGRHMLLAKPPVLLIPAGGRGCLVIFAIINKTFSTVCGRAYHIRPAGIVCFILLRYKRRQAAVGTQEIDFPVFVYAQIDIYRRCSRSPVRHMDCYRDGVTR